MRLAVNVDHFATLRQARKSDEPDPVLVGSPGRAGRGRRHCHPPARRPETHPGAGPAASPPGRQDQTQPGDGGERGDEKDRPRGPSRCRLAGSRAARRADHRRRAERPRGPNEARAGHPGASKGRHPGQHIRRPRSRADPGLRPSRSQPHRDQHRTIRRPETGSGQGQGPAKGQSGGQAWGAAWAWRFMRDTGWITGTRPRSWPCPRSSSSASGFQSSPGRPSSVWSGPWRR